VRHAQKLQGAEVAPVLGAYLSGMERLVSHVNHFRPAA
jgi:hypothetical protein